MRDQQKFIDQLRNSRDPETATKGCGYFIIWADGRGQVAYKHKQDAIDFINQNPDDDPYGMDVLSVKYREAEKGERVRNKFTEASARTYRAIKKAQQDDNDFEEVLPEDATQAQGVGEKVDQTKNVEYGFGWLIQQFPEEYSGLIEALPENMEGYDFGGAEQPFYPGLVIVDVQSPLDPTVFGSGYPDIKSDQYIEGDLTTPLNLEPKSFINISSTLSPLSFAEDLDAMFSQVVDNIDRALLPGGRVRLQDDPYLVRPVFNLLKTLGYVKVWENYYAGSIKDYEDDEDVGDVATYDIILQKPKETIQDFSKVKLNLKKAWDNPPRDEEHYPGSNTGSGGGVPHSTPKSPGSKPRRDQRTIDDYHTPSELDRDPIPGDTQPEQGTGGQSHSGEPGKVDNIYPEPSNWLRPLKRLPFNDENLLHDFNTGFDTDYTQRQYG
ncbi:hypothetical protein LCGC14_2334630, partial [marine sediment metagenome]